jgi:hypothetical protein
VLDASVSSDRSRFGSIDFSVAGLTRAAVWAGLICLVTARSSLKEPREAIEDAQAVEFPGPPGFEIERVTAWKRVGGLSVPIGPYRTAPNCSWSLLLLSARAWFGSLFMGQTAATIGRGANRRRTHPDSRQFIRPGRECDRRSRRTTLVAAISLTAAPAAQDNAAWLSGGVLAGEAAATLDPEDLTILRQRCSASA